MLELILVDITTTGLVLQTIIGLVLTYLSIKLIKSIKDANND